MLIVAPIAALLIQLGFSRQRELPPTPQVRGWLATLTD